MSDEDEDIFALTPLQRSRSQLPSSFCESKKEKKPRRLSYSQQTSASKNKSFKIPSNASYNKSTKRVANPDALAEKPGPSKRKSGNEMSGVGGSQMGKKVKQEEDLVCPLCQMPWYIYDSKGKSRKIHADECLDKDLFSKQECEKGIECSETHESHFWNFLHWRLAEERAEQERIHNSLSSSQVDKETRNKNGENVLPNSILSQEDSSAADGLVSNIQQEDCNVYLISDDESETNSKVSLKSMKLFSGSQEEKTSDKATFLAMLSDSTEDDSHSPDKQEDERFPIHSSACMDVTQNQYSDEDFFENDLDLNSEKGESEGDKETVIFSRNNSPGKCRIVKRTVVNLELDKTIHCSIPSINPLGVTCSSTSSLSESLLQPYLNTDKVGEEGIGHSSGMNEELAAPEILKPSEDLREKDVRHCTEGNGKPLQELAVPGTSNRSEEQKLLEERSETCTENSKGAVSVDVQLDSDEDEIFSNLVEQAMEKYLGDSGRGEKSLEKTLESVSTAATKKSVRCRNQGSCKPCLHLHFHIQNSPQKSPKKGGQTSILNFFQSKGSKKSPEAEPVNKCSSCCKCACKESPEKLSSKEATSSWKGLMSRMQKNSEKPPSSNSSSSSQQESKPDLQQRSCPFYKYIQDTDVVVDAFCYGVLSGVKAYFLTHFHYDHYRGLSKKFTQPIYCSEITGRLVNLRLGIPLKYLHFLPMEEPQIVCGLEVTLLEANHCPGAVMFLFKLRTGATVLHVGDFRAHPKMESYPALWNCSIDTLFLDTTYCNAVYDFPRQEDVIDKCVSVATSHVADNTKTLIVVGSYTIGKERVFKAIASALDCKIWASSDKQRTLRCIQDKEICSRLTSEKLCARVHVLPMSDLQPRKLMAYVETLKPRYSVVVAIRPTGWEHSSDQGQGLENLGSKQCGNVYIYGIPYSEHSSFNELKRFVQFIQPKKIIPTVNVGNPNSRRQMEKYFQEWQEKARHKDIGSLLRKQL
ncbi:DNA cross-link repair 1A protein-like isoform X3 [Penaeus chinensis]|uniref:DNA cross-link repair 1A protein-like isoform X3 n=1 Tax=Penaeus chinensis TaxID=139456 RepID=UPI001FB67F32|nr:DNA cross-link repair 1A protein-like isoform X3 [Penaeus chinensis]XP_047481363.1 DNA cross-link repair 1A protein-like isoform X3 [Penaeus chinensis]